MPFRDIRAHLRDIVTSVDYIRDHVGSRDFDAYRSDRKTIAAEERELQIITEAAIRLGPEAETICPGPDWTGFRGMGNLLRHAYHRIDDQLVWNTIQDELPPLCVAVSKALQTLAGSSQE